MNNKPPAPPTNKQLLKLWCSTIEVAASYRPVVYARRVLAAFGRPPTSKPAQPPNPPATPLESPQDQNSGEADEPIKRWPFAERPGDFADRLWGYYCGKHKAPESFLAAVRTTLIETPPGLADWSRSILEASKASAERGAMGGNGLPGNAVEEYYGNPADSAEPLHSALSNLIGLIKLIDTRPDVSRDLRDALTGSWRFREAVAALSDHDSTEARVK